MSAPVEPADWIVLATPDLRGREAEYLAQCVRDNWVSSAGPFVSAMEDRLAQLAERRFAIATVNGTAALHMAVLATGVQPGELVIVPDWTFAATAAAVVHANAVPYLVDVDAETWTLSPALVEDAIRKATAPIRAVIPVHVSGLPADMDRLADVCKRHGVHLIEDAAGAIGARYRNRPAGSFGAISCLSFNGNKTVTAGGGGMVLTDDADMAQFVRSRTTTARQGTAYVHEAVGWNYRMTNVNAAIGLAQIERLEEMLAAKKEIAHRYDAALALRQDMRPMPRPTWATHSCWLYNVRVQDAGASESLVAHMRDSRIETRRFWRSLAVQPPYAGMPRHLTGISATLSEQIVTLPCSSHLSGKEQERVLDALARWRGPDVTS